MEMTAMQADDGLRLMCEWFVMCDRPAEWAANGLPGQGMVPVCQRCADRVGLTADDLHEYDLEVEA